MNETRERKSTFWQGVGNIIKKSLENYIVVSHEGVTKFKVSIFTFVLLFLLLHGAVLVFALPAGDLGGGCATQPSPLG